MATINDKRADRTAPLGYLVVTDDFLSGWGEARGGRSLYALAFQDSRQLEALEIAAKHRSEMKRPRVVTSLGPDGAPKVRLHAHDHLTVVDEATAGEWYKGAAANWVS